MAEDKAEKSQDKEQGDDVPGMGCPNVLEPCV